MNKRQRANAAAQAAGQQEVVQQALRAFGPDGQPQGPARADAVGPQFVFVGLSALEMAWPASKVAGVERVGDITPVPDTVPFVLGVANLRGAITSVVDLRQFLGLPPEQLTSRSRIVVANSGGMVIGFLVDAVNEIRTLPAEAVSRETLRQSCPPWLVPYAEAVAQISGRRIFVIDLEKLLFADNLHHYRAEP